MASTFISQIKSSDGSVYELKDTEARSSIEDLTAKVNYIYTALSGAFSTKTDFKDVEMTAVLSALNNIALSAEAK